MHDYEVQVEVMRQRRERLLAAAARQRQLKLLRHQMPRHKGVFYRAMLYQVGGTLKRLGEDLQRQSGRPDDLRWPGDAAEVNGG